MTKRKFIDIYGTLGPSCEDVSVLEQMFLNGMTGVRLNLSHKSLRESEKVLENFFKASEKVEVEPKLLIDMQGPELRIGTLPEDTILTDSLTVVLGEKGIPVPNVVLESLENGDEVLIDDGKILLKVIDNSHERCTCSILRGGRLKSRKSISVVNKCINCPTMTSKDIENISLAKSYGVSGVMQPFVRNADDLKIVRKCLNENNAEDVSLFAKIENMDGVNNLASLIENCDEIVIARGDLGNSMNLWELPRIQKYISKECSRYKKRFMVVTQMLASMELNPVPTRAEVSDIYNAVIDGATSVMVTGETATGKYPAEVIKYLSNTVKEAQMDITYE